MKTLWLALIAWLAIVAIDVCTTRSLLFSFLLTYPFGVGAVCFGFTQKVFPQHASLFKYSKTFTFATVIVLIVLPGITKIILDLAFPERIDFHMTTTIATLIIGSTMAGMYLAYLHVFWVYKKNPSLFNAK